MDTRSSTGLVGTLVIALLVGVGVGGFLAGYVIDSPGEWLAPTVGSLAVAAVVVGALIALGSGSTRRLENPYW
ncbi:hypothetical protein [Natronococcus sp.]|uniref:hypothetical protein n=1 Tax=Natronococcus sp. TaxID=35747 RepID=UPI003A4D49C4